MRHSSWIRELGREQDMCVYNVQVVTNAVSTAAGPRWVKNGRGGGSGGAASGGSGGPFARYDDAAAVAGLGVRPRQGHSQSEARWLLLLRWSLLLLLPAAVPAVVTS